MRQAMVEDGLVAALTSAIQRPYNNHNEMLHQVLTILVVITGIFDEGVEEADFREANPDRTVAAKAVVE